MVAFSREPGVAEQQMQAIIVYLTTFGYIDGNFDLSEKRFVLDYIHQLVEQRVDDQGVKDPALRGEMIAQKASQYGELFNAIDGSIRKLFDEVAPSLETLERFVYAKLKLGVFEIFKGFDTRNQQILLDVVEGLIEADGVVHPAEVKFRDELRALLDKETPIPPPPPEPRRTKTGTLTMGVALPPEDVPLPPELPASGPLQLAPPQALPVQTPNHPLLEHMETHYSRNPQILGQQANADFELIQQTMNLWNVQREAGAKKLRGKMTVDDLAGEPGFLDGNVYALMPQRGKAYEIFVLGDLHGCYTCLKGALMQSDFLRKVAAYQQNPALPEPKLVFLGDYVDRGMFSFNGIMRTVMALYISAPEHVYILRGNHEYYVDRQGHIDSGVRPAEGIATLAPYFPREMFQAYMALFDEMPHALLFERILFAHAGIPRDDTLRDRWKDLSSLNDPQIRFQMMWSDPSSTNYVPIELQRENARFPFGKQQFRTFMQGIGCHTFIRGHEKIEEGCKKIYDEPDVTLINLFSAGGKNNNDLPPNASYRSVTPMALTIAWQDGPLGAFPWYIDWQAFNGPERNAFYRSAPEIEFRAF